MDSILEKSRNKIEGAEDFSFAQRIKNLIYARDGEFSHYSDAVQPLIVDGDTYISILFWGLPLKVKAHGEEKCWIEPAPKYASKMALTFLVRIGLIL